MRISFLKLMSVIFFIFIIYSLFLPHYQTLTDGMFHDSFSFCNQYPNKKEGFFGGGYYTTFNGFGSLNAILNVICSFLVLMMLLFERLTRKNFRYLFVLIIILQLLSLLEIITAPLLLNEPDSLKSGYYILRILEVGLFCIAFVCIKELQKQKREEEIKST
jgi:hypothetical protein